MIRAFTAFGSGMIFALGLGLSGMTDGAVVVGFLDVLGGWQPALMFVMVGGILTHMVLRGIVLRQATPLHDSHFRLPTATEIDRKLVAGAILFGAGWGLGGFCPGPGVVSLASGSLEAGVFVASMFLGMAMHALAVPQQRETEETDTVWQEVMEDADSERVAS